MARELKENRPCWPTVDAVTAEPLASDLDADVCIVGAGVAGLTAAYLLGREGHRVIVLEAEQPGAGESARSTGHLTCAFDDRYHNLERWHGLDGARLAAESHSAAIDRIEKLVRDENIACDFRRLDGYLFCSDEDAHDSLKMEHAAARRAGLEQVALTDKLPALYPKDWRTLLFPNQAQLDPHAYVQALAAKLPTYGSRLFGHTRVVNIEPGPQAIAITEAGFAVRARHLITATNAPLNERLGVYSPCATFRTYALSGFIQAGVVPPALYWDTHDPYHHARLIPGEKDTDLVIVGGEDLKGSESERDAEAFRRLEEWARRHFPSLGTVRHRWTAQFTETIDGLAFIGRVPSSDNLYIAAGDSGMGLTHGTIAGLLLMDLIAGRSNRWEKIYRPGRMTQEMSIAFARENRSVAQRFLHWIGLEEQTTAEATVPSPARSNAA